MKIAVCLFGTPPVHQSSIKSFFYSADHEYYLFAHSPNTLSIEVTSVLISPHYKIDSDEYLSDSIIVPVVSCPAQTIAKYNRPIQNTHITNSMMLANNLKKEYELKNNIIFDMVVNFNFTNSLGSNTFDDFIENYIHEYPTCIFGNYQVSHRDYRTVKFNSDFCFGSSSTMNIVNDFHRYYSTGKLYKLLKADYYDSAYKNLHYKALMWKWLAIKNITPMSITNKDYTCE